MKGCALCGVEFTSHSVDHIFLAWRELKANGVVVAGPEGATDTDDDGLPDEVETIEEE